MKKKPIFGDTNLIIYSGENPLRDFFKQKTAYEIRRSDWSSDVCSSDLIKKGQTTMPNEIEFEFEDAYLSKGY